MTVGPKTSKDPAGKQLTLVLGHYDLVKNPSQDYPLGGGFFPSTMV